MSAQIDKLIANIQDKFDNQFNQKPSSNQAQPTKTQTEQSKNDVVNPEISQSKVDQNPTQRSQNTTTNKKQFMKKSIKIIEQSTTIKNIKKQNSAHIQYANLPENERDQQKDQNIYKSLSNKLQTALKKITVSNPQTRKFNKNKTMSILQRFDDHQKKKQKQLQQKRHIQQQKKYFRLKQKPDIDPNSRRIATEISYKPIYQRFQQILQERKRKHQQNEQTKKAKKQEEYEEYLAEYQSHVKLQPEDCRDSQTYFNDMMQWKTKLQKQKQQKQKQKEEKSTQGYTFKPLLNQKSMKMLQNKKRIPIQDREIQKSSSHQILYAFKPKVNKRVQK